MTLSRGRLRPCRLRPHPSHQLKIQYMQVSVEVLAVPAPEHKHLVSSYKSGRMPESGGWRSSPVWTLVPSHLDGIKGMEVSEHSAFALAFAAEDENSASCQYSSVAIPGFWGSTFYLGLDPS